jgi:hypothetical protein
VVDRGLHCCSECHDDFPQLLDKMPGVLFGIPFHGSDEVYSIKISGAKTNDAVIIALLRVPFDHPAFIVGDLQYVSVTLSPRFCEVYNPRRYSS